MIELKDVAWYCIVTLRDGCIEWHLERVRLFYPDIKVYVIDNNLHYFDISAKCEPFNVHIIKNTEILGVTQNQHRHSPFMFLEHKALAFSSDDIYIFEGGFIEKSLELINKGREIVSFGTDRDPVAYLYTQKYYNEVGFDNNLIGKETSLDSLLSRTKKQYGRFDSVGEYWKDCQDPNSFDFNFWRSRYVGNPHLGKLNKTDVNINLQQINRPYK